MCVCVYVLFYLINDGCNFVLVTYTILSRTNSTAHKRSRPFKLFVTYHTVHTQYPPFSALQNIFKIPTAMGNPNSIL
jgi:hypothetical protein